MSAPAWDVVVVGGGPAGSAVGARLARAGHRVLLLDRESFPRPKPCGDCVNPAAIRELDLLGALAAVQAEPHTPLRGWQIVPRLGSAFRGEYPVDRPGMAIARTHLDRALLQHARGAGVEVRTGTRVTGLLQDRLGVVGVAAGGEEISARLVIGADGLRSVVLRRLGLLRRAPRLRKLALTAHVSGVWEAAGCGEMHLLGWGALGLAQIDDDCCNATVVVSGAEARRVAGAKDAYFDAALRRIPRMTGATRSGQVFATGPFDWPVRAAIADGAALVGDAAGYYDPFTGQGIFRALRGAALLAETADHALRAGDLSARALRPYERARRRAFDPGTRLQRVIEEFLARPGALRGVAELLARRPRAADLLIRVAGDVQPVRSLWSPGMVGRLLAAER